MTSVLTKIVAVVAGLAILLTFGSLGRGLRGIAIPIAIVVAAAIAIAALRSFGVD